MEYVYAALILNESGEEINEDNLTNVLDAAGVDVEESRVKALVAALEDVDIDEAVSEAAAVPCGGAAAGAAADEAAADEGGDGTRKPKRPATCRTRRTTTTRTTRPTARVSANSSDNAHVDSGFDELLPSILFRLEGSGDFAPPRGDVIPPNWDGAGPRPYKRSRGQSRGCPPQSRSSPSRR